MEPRRVKPLEQLPDGSRVFTDANIFLLAMLDMSNLGAACAHFLARTASGNVQGYTATHIVGEVIHRLMVHEAREQYGLPARDAVQYLQQHPEAVRSLTRHVSVASDIRALGIDIRALTVKDLHASKTARTRYGLLANDALLLAAMLNHRVAHLASNDAAFARVASVQMWRPLP